MIRRREKRGHEWREPALEMHDDRMVVAAIDRADHVVTDAADDVITRIEHLLPRVDYVVRIERRTVLPLHTAAQMVRDLQPVAADAAVRGRGFDGRQLGVELAAVIQAKQQRPPKSGDVVVDDFRTQLDVEIVRILTLGDT